jgi:hypothetical protein
MGRIGKPLRIIEAPAPVPIQAPIEEPAHPSQVVVEWVLMSRGQYEALIANQK